MDSNRQIYLGRMVAFAVTPSGRPAALYRVSSRSFPNRTSIVSADGQQVSIVPKSGHETDIRKNPYISYNCARLLGRMVVLSNGAHTDPIADKMGQGMAPRDALALGLLAMDYEKDDYSTPRIAVTADHRENSGWLGTVRKDGLEVRSFALEAGTLIHLSTYGHDVLEVGRRSAFTPETPEEACRFLISGGVFAGFSCPVTTVAAVSDGQGFRLAALDVRMAPDAPA